MLARNGGENQISFSTMIPVPTPDQVRGRLFGIMLQPQPAARDPPAE